MGYQPYYFYLLFGTVSFIMSIPPGTWGGGVHALKYQNRALSSTQKRGPRTGMLLLWQNKIL